MELEITSGKLLHLSGFKNLTGVIIYFFSKQTEYTSIAFPLPAESNFSFVFAFIEICCISILRISDNRFLI